MGSVKVTLFQAYRHVFVYDIALWRHFTAHSFNKFHSCYYKCINAFIGYAKYNSVTNVLLELKLPSFNTVLHNAKVTFCTSFHSVDNRIVHAINCSS